MLLAHKILISLLVICLATVFLNSYRKKLFLPNLPLETQIVIDVQKPQNVSLPRNNRAEYYNFSSESFRLFVYSAIYDDRSSLLSLPVVRLTAVSDKFEELQKRNITRLYCILHHDSKDIIVIMEDNPNPIGYGWPLNNIDAKEYIYTCPTIRGMIPKSVSIVTKQTDHFPSGVPVTLPNNPKEKQDFCVCVQAAYGTLNPYRLIEWLELQRILGVSLVGVYILSASKEVLKVFEHYSDEKFVDLRKINYLYSNKSNHQEFWLHLTPAINDCIYRHMHEFKRMIVIDFDEFIMPRKHENLTELVKFLDHMYMEKHSPHVNYAFRNNYFFLDLEPNGTESKYLKFLSVRKKVAVSGEGYSEKSLINPQACVHMHNHRCWGVTSNYSSIGNTASVDPDIALNQHYKKCHFSHTECEKMMKNVIEDNIMMRFKEDLAKNVKEKVLKIMGHDI